ncbi:MAG: glycosyltransferase [Nocardioides sp.]
MLVLINGVVDTSGGNLRAAVNIAEALAADGRDVTFSAPIVLSQPHRTVLIMDDRVDRRLFPATRPVARFGGSARQLAWLVRHVRDFDEVQTHSLFSLSTVYAVAICAIRGVPIFLWPHGSIDPFDLRKHARFKSLVGPVVTRRLLDRCAAIVFTTPHEEQIAVTYGATVPHAVVPLPVVPVSTDDDTGAWRSRFGLPADAPVVLFLGRIDYKKRLPLLVESVSLLERPDVHLAVVGDGPAPDTALLHDAARTFGVSERVHVTGWVEGADRAAAFSVADVFVLLSDAENFGLSIIEALSVGCPAVVSDRVFLAEDLQSAGVAVVVERDAVQAARAIDAILGDPVAAIEMGTRAKEFVASRYSQAAVGACLRELSAGVDESRSGSAPSCID